MNQQLFIPSLIHSTIYSINFLIIHLRSHILYQLSTQSLIRSSTNLVTLSINPLISHILSQPSTTFLIHITLNLATYLNQQLFIPSLIHSTIYSINFLIIHLRSHILYQLSTQSLIRSSTNPVTLSINPLIPYILSQPSPTFLHLMTFSFVTYFNQQIFMPSPIQSTTYPINLLIIFLRSHILYQLSTQSLIGSSTNLVTSTHQTLTSLIESTFYNISYSHHSEFSHLFEPTIIHIFTYSFNYLLNQLLIIVLRYLIENVYQKKKGWKFHDKWLGPYRIAKLNRNTVKIYRNKSIQRVKRSKVKLLKRLTPINSADQQATRSQRLSTEIETSAIEYLQAEDTPSIGAEETVFATISPSRHTRQDTIDKLNSMKSLIINSIKTNIPLSDLHRELHKRRDMKFKDLFNWRTDSYPSYYTESPQEDQLKTTYEMSNLLAQWYLDSFEIKIPEYQYTGEDFDFSTRWSEESMDYSTKVLLPVVEQLLATSKAPANSDNTLATPHHFAWKIHVLLGVVNSKEMN